MVDGKMVMVLPGQAPVELSSAPEQADLKTADPADAAPPVLEAPHAPEDTFGPPPAVIDPIPPMPVPPPPEPPSLTKGLADTSYARRDSTRPGTRPGSNPGNMPGHSTSPGVAAGPGVINDDFEAAPPVAVAVIRRGAKVADTAFLKELFEAESPAILAKKIPTVVFAQRTWYASEEDLVRGAREYAVSLAAEHRTNPDRATWHITYGPGHAKVLLILLRR
jgi:hypothetical protein